MKASSNLRCRLFHLLHFTLPMAVAAGAAAGPVAQTVTVNSASSWYDLREVTAAAQTNSEAMRQLFIAYRYGPGVPRDDEEARKWLRKSAENGNAIAQCQLGHFLENPLAWDVNTMIFPVSNSMPEAVRWYRASAAQGYSGAQYYLSLCHLKGKGVSLDEEHALELMRLAADQTNSYALATLAELYARGIGEPRNNNDSPLELLVRSEALSPANEQGHSTASTISFRYRVGMGTERDLVKAASYHWRGIAYENRHQNEPSLTVPAIVPNADPVTAAETFYLRAAILRDPTAFLKIGEMYLKGEGTPRDPETAWVWLTLASQIDESKARSALSSAGDQLSANRATLLLPRVAQLSDELNRLATSFKRR